MWSGADQTASATAEGVGNPVFLIGSSTGRDGIHGATFASEELSEESEEKRSSVQVGDPFMEKLLLEASIELIQSGDLVGIQDMGAAGITCSCSEMSAKGKCGIRIHVERIPQRETGMTPYEVLLSESQERMLVVMQKGREQTVLDICAKWDIHAEQIGEVTDTGLFEVYHEGELKSSIPAEVLVLGGGAPVYEREWKEPAYYKELRDTPLPRYQKPEDLSQELRELMAHENVISRRWIYQQYDHMIGTATELRPGGDAAAVRVKHTSKHISCTTDCNAALVQLDPREGTRLAVAEAARNIACTGGQPLAITNCLNFGNPYDPEVYWQFREAIAGMGEACRFFNTPVTGGNVSFYNESPKAAIHPTPVIGMIGLQEEGNPVPSAFRGEGELILLLGDPCAELGGSLYLRRRLGELRGRIPQVNLQHEQRLHKLLTFAASKDLTRSAHDVAEGGLAVTLAECCLCDPDLRVGARVTLKSRLAPDVLLFAETPGLVVVSILPEHNEAYHELARELGVPCRQIGVTGGLSLQINNWVDCEVEELAQSWWNRLSVLMEG